MKSVRATHSPTQLIRALKVLDELMEQNDDLKVKMQAATLVIEQERGKAGQKLDVTSNGQTVMPNVLTVEVVRPQDNAPRQ